MEFFTKFPVMERSALAELRKGIDFVFRDFSRAYGDSIEAFFDPLLFFLFVIIFTGEALSIGLALMIVILILGKFSGGHFNPAVTIMMVFAKKLNATDALPYILAQITGGLTALLIYKNIK